jgi:hypothetical protein
VFLDLLYLILGLLHVSLELLLSLGFYQLVPSLLFRDGPTLIFVDRWLEAVLLLIVLLGLVEELLAFVRSRRTTSFYVLFDVVGYCWVVKLALDMFVHVFTGVSLLWFWRLFT